MGRLGAYGGLTEGVIRQLSGLSVAMRHLVGISLLADTKKRNVAIESQPMRTDYDYHEVATTLDWGASS